MKLVRNKKVVALRPKYASVQRVIKSINERAHLLQGVIIIEIPKKSAEPQPHIVSHSTMRLDALAWGMNVANKEISDIINQPSTKE